MSKRKLYSFIKSKLLSRALLGVNIELNGKKEDKNRTKS